MTLDSVARLLASHVKSCCSPSERSGVHKSRAKCNARLLVIFIVVLQPLVPPRKPVGGLLMPKGRVAYTTSVVQVGHFQSLFFVMSSTTSILRPPLISLANIRTRAGTCTPSLSCSNTEMSSFPYNSALFDSISSCLPFFYLPRFFLSPSVLISPCALPSLYLTRDRQKKGFSCSQRVQAGLPHAIL